MPTSLPHKLRIDALAPVHHNALAGAEGVDDGEEIYPLGYLERGGLFL